MDAYVGDGVRQPKEGEGLNKRRRGALNVPDLSVCEGRAAERQGHRVLGRVARCPSGPAGLLLRRRPVMVVSSEPVTMLGMVVVAVGVDVQGTAHVCR